MVRLATGTPAEGAGAAVGTEASREMNRYMPIASTTTAIAVPAIHVLGMVLVLRDVEGSTCDFDERVGTAIFPPQFLQIDDLFHRDGLVEYARGDFWRRSPGPARRLAPRPRGECGVSPDTGEPGWPVRSRTARVGRS